MFKKVLTLLLLSVSVVGTSYSATYHVSPNGNDANPGTEQAPFREIKKATTVVQPGDTVLVADGEYAGGIEHRFKPATQAAPIIYKAVGAGAIIRGDQTALRDAVYIEASNWVTLQGFTIRNAIRAGVRVSDTTNVTLRNLKCLNNTKWGIFTDYVDDLLIEGCECAFSGAEHGIYISNSGDRPIVRGNSLHDNNASGVQINADPSMLRPELGARGDGISEGALIEKNIIFNNGAIGGAGVNLSSVRNSKIINNLIYNNKAGGVAAFDNGNGIQWGSRNNLIAHNTIYFSPNTGRWCVSLKNGSTGNIVRNNILSGGNRGGFDIDNDSSLQSDCNLIFSQAGQLCGTNEDVGVFWSLSQWQANTGNDLSSVFVAAGFVSVPTNFQLQAGSLAVNLGLDAPEVGVDLLGVVRPQSGKWDAGAYEFVGAVPTPTPVPGPVADTKSVDFLINGLKYVVSVGLSVPTSVALSLPAPSDLVVNALTYSGSKFPELTWKDNSESELAFLIWSKDSVDSSWKVAGVVPGGVVKMTLWSSIRVGRTYTFRVQGLGDAGSSKFSNEVSVSN